MCEIKEIRVLNLGNADAIIVVLQKGEDILVILIDTGRDYHLNEILDELRNVLKKWGKPGPDLVVCTHYDFDHIGGLIGIVGRYQAHIKEVWMHTTSKLIEIADRLETGDDPSSLILPNEEAEALTIEGNGIIDYDDDEVQDVLQQLKHEVAALHALEDLGIKPKEPIFGNCTLAGWEEIEVIGPTYEYYQSLFPAHFDFSGYIEAEKTELKASVEASEEVETAGNPFEQLDSLKRTQISPTNRNSVIIQIESHQGKFLFAGDAGIESFQNIPDYDNKIRDIHFFKVPHHGSANNLNSELIQLMNPDIAFIPGGSHVSPKVVNALRHVKAMVLVTEEEGKTLVYPAHKPTPLATAGG